MNLKERAEKLVHDLYHSCQNADIPIIESAFREIRNETLEEAAIKAGSYEVASDIRALKEKNEKLLMAVEVMRKSLAGCICNGPMSYAIHSAQRERIATNALAAVDKILGEEKCTQ